LEKVLVKWLGGKPVKDGGATWGIPWRKGALKREVALKAKTNDGTDIPLQSWATAYWPDGSVKWTAHSAAFKGVAPSEFYVIAGEGDTSLECCEGISVSGSEECIEVDTGAMTCIFNKNGRDLIREIRIGNISVCSGGRLLCLIEERLKTSGLDTTVTSEYYSDITEVRVEQDGPVRCVIRVKGWHLSRENNRDWSPKKIMPFDVRFYFYAGLCSIKVVHTFVYSGNQNTDFIKGLGIRLSLPLSGELYNRHVRLSGDTGLFSESPKNLATIRTTGKYEEMFRAQIDGETVAFDQEEDAKFLGLLDESAVWDSFKIVQLVPDFYTIYKRTKACCAYIKAASGRRSQGLAYAGWERGGMAASVRNFWQKCPSSIEINGMSTDETDMTLWFWSPDAQAMDLRHYDTETHVHSAYEGFQEMRSTPFGIANTSEVMLWCFEGMPGNRKLLELAREGADPSLPVCVPETYRAARVFGEWGLVDRSTPERAYIEDQLDAIIGFYQGEIERRKWYGFWDYGDVMHSYDRVRHSWRYDIGGCAWQNTELMPNMWLWYSFLRSGRKDVFRMAEAMTRHNSEVDVYHMGEYAGLGSRHNVIHWGCGCKEDRISMAALNRYYYYLTADERTGDLMDEVKDADLAVGKLDPMRAYYERDPRFTTHVRIGPDVMAFCSNWFTRWERYEDEEYRDKLVKCLEFLKEKPQRFISGVVVGYDPLGTRLHDIGLYNGGNGFNFCFGAQFIWVEIAQAMEDSVFDEMCMDLGQFYSDCQHDREEILAEWGVPNKGFRMSVYNSGLAAYAASRRNNEELAREVWEVLATDPERMWAVFPIRAEEVAPEGYPVPVAEVEKISTNSVSQWTINTIMSLGLIGDKIPKGFHERHEELGG
jgi:hypothetical protein